MKRIITKHINRIATNTLTSAIKCRHQSNITTTNTSATSSKCRHQSSIAATVQRSNSAQALATPISNIINPALKRTPSLYRDGQFHNPWPTSTNKSMFDRFCEINQWLKERKYFLGSMPHPLNPQSYENAHEFPEPFNHLHKIDLDEHLPVIQPDLQFLTECGLNQSKQITHTWIGHASCLVQLGDVTILTDPWFSQRTSAWQAVGPKRIRPPACEIEQLPPLDVITISHNHFDHCDYNSIVALAKKVSIQEQETDRLCRWYVPLGLKNFLIRWGNVPPNRIHELDWWQTVEQKQHCSTSPYSVTAVGAQHWTSRWAWTDTRHTLWCGFVIEANARKFYFVGDTAYCPVFQEIGSHYKDIDISSIPVGAYRPRQLLYDVHVDPSEAVKIHQEVGSKHSVAIHWGTVMLGDEFIMEPKFELERAVHQAGLKDDSFVTSHHGQTIVIE